MSEYTSAGSIGKLAKSDHSPTELQSRKYLCFFTHGKPIKGVVPMDEWEKNPDTGIPALREAYRREQFGIIDYDPVPQRPIKFRKTNKSGFEAKKPGRKKKVVTEDQPKPKPERKPKAPKPKPERKPKAPEPKPEQKPKSEPKPKPQSLRSMLEQLDTPKLKYCRCCLQLQPRANFCHDSQTKDKLKARCKRCEALSKKYKLSTKEIQLKLYPNARLQDILLRGQKSQSAVVDMEGN